MAFETHSSIRSRSVQTIKTFSMPVTEVEYPALTFCRPNLDAGDYTRAVFNNLPKDAKELMDTFTEFANISGLALNLPKTVVFPLWRTPCKLDVDFITDYFPEWGVVDVTLASLIVECACSMASSRCWLSIATLVFIVESPHR